MNVNRCPVLECPRLATQQSQAHVDSPHGRVHGRIEYPEPPLDHLFSEARANQIQRAALPGTPRLRRPVLLVDARTRAVIPGGDNISSSPTRTSPACAVPVTTVPAPLSVKQRSIARRK